MADPIQSTQIFSGKAVRGIADNTAETPAQTVAGSNFHDVEESFHHAADLAMQAFDAAGQAIGRVVDATSDKAFESAADVGVNIATPVTQAVTQGSFSWGGYLQAIGVLCFLLAALWFAVWLIRRFGKFNFMPRPGALPKEALFMEAQMPLGPKKGLMVVRFMHKRLLLGVTEQRISLLAEDSVQNERPENNFQGYMDHTSDFDADSH